MRLTICDALLNLLVNNRVEGPSALTIRLPGTGRLDQKISARMRALCRFFPSDTIQSTILPGHCSLSRLQAESPSPTPLINTPLQWCACGPHQYTLSSSGGGGRGEEVPLIPCQRLPFPPATSSALMVPAPMHG